MIGYLEALNTMHTRGVSIDEKDYKFTLMVVLGETPQVAYGMVYDTSEFRKHIGTEEEEAYLSSKKDVAERTLAQQSIMQLKDVLSEAYRAQIQKASLNLTDYHFSGQETVQILNNLLKTRIDDLETSSVKDVVSLLKALSEQGALEMGDGGFSRHFIQVFPKFTALCISCNREFQTSEGLGCVCPHCGQQYQWVEEQQKFIPSPTRL